MNANRIWGKKPDVDKLQPTSARQMEINAVQNALLFAAVEIGSIVNMAHWASSGIATRVHMTGKPFQEITVGDLLDMLKAHDELHASLEQELLQEGAGYDQ